MIHPLPEAQPSKPTPLQEYLRGNPKPMREKLAADLRKVRALAELETKLGNVQALSKLKAEEAQILDQQRRMKPWYAKLGVGGWLAIVALLFVFFCLVVPNMPNERQLSALGVGAFVCFALLRWVIEPRLSKGK